MVHVPARYSGIVAQLKPLIRASERQRANDSERTTASERQRAALRATLVGCPLLRMDLDTEPRSGGSDDTLGFVARWDGTCCLCGEPTHVGERLYPNGCGGLWCHLRCAVRVGLTRAQCQRPVCKHWARGGSCLYGNRCFFRHDAAAARSVAETNRRTWGGRRRKVRNDSRANVFRRFLLDTFGAQTLKSGTGVMDVAGGKGELAFQLLNLNGVRATVVDPRPLQLRQFRRRLAAGMFHRNVVLSAHVSEAWEGPGALGRDPAHVALCLDEALLSAAGLGASSATHGPREGDGGLVEFLRAAHQRALQLRWTKAGLHEDDSSEAGDDVATHDDGDAGVDDVDGEAASVAPASAAEVLALLRGASAVVGMHPDQATVPIVDLALRTGKPFACVPCCVYSKEFTSRTLNDGTPVRSYSQLVRYILEKAPRYGRTIETTILPFGGKNLCIYSRAPSNDDGSTQASSHH